MAVAQHTCYREIMLLVYIMLIVAHGLLQATCGMIQTLVTCALGNMLPGFQLGSMCSKQHVA